MGELRDAFKAPFVRPPPTSVAVALRPALEAPGPIKSRLLREASAEELHIARREPTEQACQPVAKLLPKEPVAPPQPRHAPGDLLFVQYKKAGEDYILEYRKDADGTAYLYHAEPHLVEQLKGLPVKEHKDRMQRMRYKYVKWFQND